MGGNGGMGRRGFRLQPIKTFFGAFDPVAIIESRTAAIPSASTRSRCRARSSFIRCTQAVNRGSSRWGRRLAASVRPNLCSLLTVPCSLL